MPALVEGHQTSWFPSLVLLAGKIFLSRRGDRAYAGFFLEALVGDEFSLRILPVGSERSFCIIGWSDISLDFEQGLTMVSLSPTDRFCTLVSTHGQMKH